MKELLGAPTLITGLAIVALAAAATPVGSGSHAAPLTKAEQAKAPSGPTPTVKY